ncbi:glycosyltransferase [Flavitalea sp. BT771]|uniref:glycosyltransferase n=1 Tax=Flavitalea sp. BT771 TaxID=3063329 RepID=UPI0026E1EABA|nr:nucleotide disphospho-sugar-binding domain-containing protein [Flavitalea sp. BT771]MDO6435191.1 glycosyltransferase [Flavitalea sp. BT771]MDV6224104.1 glycosyltransferase [Flavitalea sp. BT771]
MKILFANFPADGHFNPLTGLAIHLQEQGHEVRWYTSQVYAPKLRQMQIAHYPFKRAMDLSGDHLEELFPERNKKTSQLSKLKFDLINAFILRGPEYYADIQEIRKEYAFDLLVADCAFTGTPFVKDLMKIPTVSIGVFPLTETSKDLPPAGLGMTPSGSLIGKARQALLRRFANTVIFREPNRVLYQLLDEYKIPHNSESLFDMIIRKSDLLLQIGTPGFEYYRSDLGENIRFVGALLPHTGTKQRPRWYNEKLREYRKIVLVTQGTVEKDVTKIIVPTLEAFKSSDTLVIATTGGSGTQQLRDRYPYKNIIIEDFIPFSDVMPYVTAYVTNGGYGGTMLGIMNKLPMVVAGVHEGKNEICARVGYFKLGINLRTERPTPRQIQDAVNRIIMDDEYRANVKELAAEFARFNPYERSARCIASLAKKTNNNPSAKLHSSYVIPFSS